MPTFSPPIVSGPAPVGGKSSPLWRHYGNHDCGVTVWKDQFGAWHQQLFPYQGGFNHRTYNDTQFTQSPDTSVKSLANATEVYMGGSKYEVTEAKADELRAAGFFVGGHWKSEEDKWTQYVLNSPVNRGYKGGDAQHSIHLEDGSNRSLWVHADTFVGSTDSGGFVIGNGVVKNSCIFRNSDGTLDPNQIYAAGVGQEPAWRHPNHPGQGFTPMDIIYDGLGTGVDNILVIGWSEPTLYSQALGEGLIMRLTVFLTPNSFVDYPLVDNPYEILPSQGKFNVTSVYNDTSTGYHYILGRDQDLSRTLAYPFTSFPNAAQTQYVRIARVALGQLTTPANWEYWTGSAWVTGQEPTVIQPQSRLYDVSSNEPLEGLVDMTKVGTDYIIALIRVNSPAVQCFKSKTPQGPWTLYHVADNPDRKPDAGLDPPSARGYWSGFPKFHEYLNPSPNTLVISHSHGLYQLNGSLTPPDKMHASQYTPNFVYIPVPSVFES